MNGCVIITGCAGFIGNHLVRLFIEKGYDVIGIDNLSTGNIDFLPKVKNFILYQFDLSQQDITKEILKQICDKYKPTAIYHLAGYDCNILSPFIRNYNYTNNILCSANIINEAINHNLKVIYASSSSVYGENALPYNESMAPMPNNPYSIAKYAVEKDLLNANACFGIKYNIIRFDNLIGIYGDMHDPYKSIFNIYTNRILNNMPILIYGNGHQTRSFLDIRCCLDALFALVDTNDNEIFNIGSEQYCSINKIAGLFADAAKKLDLTTKITYTENVIETSNIFCDISKAKDMLKFNDTTNLEKCINEILEWWSKYNKNETRSIRYEINKKLYSFYSNSKPEDKITLEIESKEYFEDGAKKRYRKSYG